MNIVNEIDALSEKITLEKELRPAMDLEIQRGIEDGPMTGAHDAVVEEIVLLARSIVMSADDLGRV